MKFIDDQKPEQQKLINIMFEMVYRITQDRPDWRPDRDEAMAWVAYNLKECGFPTAPVGMSWGCLIEPEPEKDNRRIRIDIAGRPE
jgi:hypothetical protein